MDVVTSRGSFNHEVRLPKGDPENPFSNEELKEKFSQNAGKVLKTERIEEIQSSTISSRRMPIPQRIRSET